MKSSFKLIGSILIFTTFVLMHKSLERNSFDVGMSWTLSAFVPYILQFIAAFLVAFQVVTLVRNKGHLFKRLFFLVSLIAFCGVAFWAHPIFEGDFSNDKQEVVIKTNDGNVFNEGLTMAALPGCRFCFGRIPLLNELKSRNPKLNISVLIVSESQETFEVYNSELVGTINVSYSPHGNLIAQTTKGRFPAFFYANNKGELFYWDQKGFGTLALDWIEGRY